MSYDKYPPKEKLGTDLDSQLAWLVQEMGYSRDKVKGYEEKLVRLARDPSDVTSVFGFMSGYWHRFQHEEAALEELMEPAMASRALQANAKVVAGLCDKVAFALWLQDRIAGTTHEPQWLLDTALGMVKEQVGEVDGTYSDEELLDFNDRVFEANPMGLAILGLHESYRQDPSDTDTLLTLALEGSATGILMWQAYARNLETKGYSSVMPQPGLPSGNIETWD